MGNGRKGRFRPFARVTLRCKVQFRAKNRVIHRFSTGAIDCDFMGQSGW